MLNFDFLRKEEAGARASLDTLACLLTNLDSFSSCSSSEVILVCMARRAAPCFTFTPVSTSSSFLCSSFTWWMGVGQKGRAKLSKLMAEMNYSEGVC